MENFYRAQSTFVDTFTTAQNKNKNKNNDKVVVNKIYTNRTNLVLPDNSNHPPPLLTSSPRPGAVTMNESKGRTTTTKHKPSSSRSKSRFDSRDMDRRKRIATYKLYRAEGQMKRSFKKGICWIKGRYSKIVYGF